MKEPWMKWAVLEALMKVFATTLHKVTGIISASIGHLLFATAVAGFVQAVVGFVLARTNKKFFAADAVGIAGSLLFGFFAVVSGVLVMSAYLYGGEVGVVVFITTLSIVPGALIDRVFFGYALNTRQWLGIAIAILAGYSILGWPSLHEAFRLPLWVWLALGTMLSLAINQGITQHIKEIDPFVKNFWGGLTRFILAAVAIFIFYPPGASIQYLSMQKLIVVSAAVGIIGVGMWSFNLLSYKTGASIALKKLVMNGSYLALSLFAGMAFFGEALTVSKVLGVILFVAAFVLMDKGTWRVVISAFVAMRSNSAGGPHPYT